MAGGCRAGGDSVDFGLPLRFGHFDHKLVQRLVEQRKGDPDGILGVGNEDADHTVGGWTCVYVSHVRVLLNRLTLRRLCSLCYRLFGAKEQEEKGNTVTLQSSSKPRCTQKQSGMFGKCRRSLPLP